MTDDAVEIGALLAGTDLEPWVFEDDEAGAVIVDAFVIVRYQRPEWPNPRSAYIGTKKLGDEERIGLLTIVCDRIRDRVRRGWMGDDE